MSNNHFASLSEERRIRAMLVDLSTGELHNKLARLMAGSPESPMIPVINEILTERSGA